mgnify:CR=1 FL=1
MKIPVEIIKFIYFHDETVDEGYFYENTLGALCDYSKLFQDILVLSKNRIFV